MLPMLLVCPPPTGGQAGHLPTFKWIHISELRKAMHPTLCEKQALATRWVHARAVELRRPVDGLTAMGMLRTRLRCLGRTCSRL